MVAAILTIMGLIIGFTFSMAVGRYDQRKNYEEEEANAIGTEYLRAGLLPAADAKQVRMLLTRYVDQRIVYYVTRNDRELQQTNHRTAQLQTDLWTAVQAPGAAQPNPVVALAVGGMNDVINSQGYSQAAWWNRIPSSAWALMGAIAIFSSAMVGYGAKSFKAEAYFLWVLPVVLSISFMLIADIDSPRSGLILLKPQNLISLANSIRVPQSTQ
ncbi:hypothetical protein EDF57_1212 [Novosphingobium sp. PhB55]|nr:hypothetical protein EDF57_1212 [Novosphingobium sp. PhB55]